MKYLKYIVSVTFLALISLVSIELYGNAGKRAAPKVASPKVASRKRAVLADEPVEAEAEELGEPEEAETEEEVPVKAAKRAAVKTPAFIAKLAQALTPLKKQSEEQLRAQEAKLAKQARQLDMDATSEFEAFIESEPDEEMKAALRKERDSVQKIVRGLKKRAQQKVEAATENEQEGLLTSISILLRDLSRQKTIRSALKSSAQASQRIRRRVRPTKRVRPAERVILAEARKQERARAKAVKEKRREALQLVKKNFEPELEGLKQEVAQNTPGIDLEVAIVETGGTLSDLSAAFKAASGALKRAVVQSKETEEKINQYMVVKKKRTAAQSAIRIKETIRLALTTMLNSMRALNNRFSELEMHEKRFDEAEEEAQKKVKYLTALQISIGKKLQELSSQITQVATAIDPETGAQEAAAVKLGREVLEAQRKLYERSLSATKKDLARLKKGLRKVPALKAKIAQSKTIIETVRKKAPQAEALEKLSIVEKMLPKVTTDLLEMEIIFYNADKIRDHHLQAAKDEVLRAKSWKEKASQLGKATLVGAAAGAIVGGIVGIVVAPGVAATGATIGAGVGAVVGPPAVGIPTGIAVGRKVKKLEQRGHIPAGVGTGIASAAVGVPVGAGAGALAGALAPGAVPGAAAGAAIGALGFLGVAGTKALIKKIKRHYSDFNKLHRALTVKFPKQLSDWEAELRKGKRSLGLLKTESPPELHPAIDEVIQRVDAALGLIKQMRQKVQAKAKVIKKAKAKADNIKQKIQDDARKAQDDLAAKITAGNLQDIADTLAKAINAPINNPASMATELQNLRAFLDATPPAVANAPHIARIHKTLELLRDRIKAAPKKGERDLLPILNPMLEEVFIPQALRDFKARVATLANPTPAAISAVSQALGVLTGDIDRIAESSTILQQSMSELERHASTPAVITALKSNTAEATSFVTAMDRFLLALHQKINEAKSRTEQSFQGKWWTFTMKRFFMKNELIRVHDKQFSPPAATIASPTFHQGLGQEIRTVYNDALKTGYPTIAGVAKNMDHLWKLRSTAFNVQRIGLKTRIIQVEGHLATGPSVAGIPAWLRKTADDIRHVLSQPLPQLEKFPLKTKTPPLQFTLQQYVPMLESYIQSNDAATENYIKNLDAKVDQWTPQAIRHYFGVIQPEHRRLTTIQVFNTALTAIMGSIAPIIEREPSQPPLILNPIEIRQKYASYINELISLSQSQSQAEKNNFIRALTNMRYQVFASGPHPFRGCAWIRREIYQNYQTQFANPGIPGLIDAIINQVQTFFSITQIMAQRKYLWERLKELEAVTVSTKNMTLIDLSKLLPEKELIETTDNIKAPLRQDPNVFALLDTISKTLETFKPYLSHEADRLLKLLNPFIQQINSVLNSKYLAQALGNNLFAVLNEALKPLEKIMLFLTPQQSGQLAPITKQFLDHLSLFRLRHKIMQQASKIGLDNLYIQPLQRKLRTNLPNLNQSRLLELNRNLIQIKQSPQIKAQRLFREVFQQSPAASPPPVPAPSPAAPAPSPAASPPPAPAPSPAAPAVWTPQAKTRTIKMINNALKLLQLLGNREFAIENITKKTSKINTHYYKLKISLRKIQNQSDSPKIIPNVKLTIKNALDDVSQFNANHDAMIQAADLVNIANESLSLLENLAGRTHSGFRQKTRQSLNQTHSTQFFALLNALLSAVKQNVQNFDPFTP